MGLFRKDSWKQKKKKLLKKYMKAHEKRKLSDSKGYLEEILEKEPDDNEIRLLYASTLSQMDQGEEALDIIEEILEEEPNNESAHFRHMLLLIGLGRHEDAIDKITSVYGPNPEDEKINAFLTALRKKVAMKDVKKDLQSKGYEFVELPKEIKEDKPQKINGYYVTDHSSAQEAIAKIAGDCSEGGKVILLEELASLANIDSKTLRMVIKIEGVNQGFDVEYEEVDDFNVVRFSPN